MKKTVSDEKRFIAIATVILVVISIVALFPMILLVVASFTDENELITNGYQILPKKLSLEAYTYNWNNRCRNRIKRATDNFDRISDGTKNIQI